MPYQGYIEGKALACKGQKLFKYSQVVVTFAVVTCGSPLFAPETAALMSGGSTAVSGVAGAKN